MKKKLLSAVLVLVLLLAMIPATAGAAAVVTDIEIARQYSTLYSTDYTSPYIALSPADYQYKVTFSDGSVKTTDVSDTLLDFSELELYYAGEYVSYEYPTVLRSGKQAVDILYQGNTYKSYVTISGLHEEFGAYHTIDADEDITFEEFGGPEGWFFWHVKMSTSGTYSLYASFGFDDLMSGWCIQVFDKYNNEVPSADGTAQWQLVSGQDYYLSVRCTFKTAFRGSPYMFLSRTGAMSGSNRFAPPAITELTNSLNGVSVKWNPVAGAAKYRVFYKTPTGSWTKAGDTTSTNLTVTGLASGINYTFTVRCIDASGNFTSSLDPIGKSITYLMAPKLTYIGTSVKGVELKWNAVKGAENYGVWYKTATGAWTKAGNTTDTQYVVSGLTSGTTYTFTVRCLSADGKSYTSGFDSVGKTFMYLETPKLSYIGTSVKGVEVKWNPVKNAENYGVWYRTATGAWTKAGNTTGTEMVVGGLTSGTTYTFTVRCLSADGKTYMSGFDATGKTFTYLETPKLSYIGTSVKGVEVKWNPVKNAENYGVWYKTATGAWTKAGNTTGTEMVVSGLTSGTTYTFTVRCLSADGKTYMSGFDAAGKTFMYLETPKLNYIGTSVKGVEVKWNPVKNAVNYGIWYKTATGAWTKAGTTTGNQFVVSGLTSGTTYTFTVRCLSADGKTYMSGFDAVGKQFTYLTTPTVSEVTQTAEGAKVSWAPVTGAAMYRVFYKTAGGSWTKAADVTGDSYTVTGLKEGVTYTFTVRCIDANGGYASGFDSVGKTLTMESQGTDAVGGRCGESAYWTIDSKGTLVISGSGAMYDYEMMGSPWSGYYNDIKAIQVESGINSIGTYALSGLPYAASISLAGTVTTIGDYAFYGNSGFSTIQLPASVTTIGSWAFGGCVRLTKLVLPASLVSIGDFAFGDCGYLTSVTIPASIQSIGTGAFADDDSLTDVYYTGSEAQWQAVALGEINDNLLSATLHFNTAG